MILCLCCHRTGLPVTRHGVEVMDNMYDRAPTSEQVEWLECEWCGSDLVEDVSDANELTANNEVSAS
jgi:hypothetical protein